jgi:hypothetical protein
MVPRSLAASHLGDAATNVPCTGRLPGKMKIMSSKVYTFEEVAKDD